MTIVCCMCIGCEYRRYPRLEQLVASCKDEFSPLNTWRRSSFHRSCILTKDDQSSILDKDGKYFDTVYIDKYILEPFFDVLWTLEGGKL